MDGPSPDLAQVDIVILTDKDGLGERRLVIPVIKRRKTVFNAVGRGEEAEMHLFPADSRISLTGSSPTERGGKRNSII